MNFRLPLVAMLALSAAACSHRDEASNAAAARAGASASVASGALSPAGAHPALAHGYRNRFAAAPDRGSLVAYPAVPVVRHDGAYTSYLASISEAHARGAIGGVLTVPLPNGEQLRFRYGRHVEHPNGDWTWVGDAIGAKGQQAIITFGDKAAFGTIGQAGEQPWRLTVQNGASWLIRTDAAQIATIVNDATRPTSPDYIVPPGQIGSTHRTASSGAMTASAATAAPAAAGSASNTVDLVIGYTPGFVGYYGGDSQAQTRLNNMVDITNQAYVNSGVDARVRLVKTMLVQYADNTSNVSALEGLTGFKAPSTQTTPDQAFSALRAARDQYGADLVSLVRRFQTPENEGCGIAWLIGGAQSPIDSSDGFFGYSVVSDGKDAGTDGKNYYCREETLAHELGHNMGAQHDRATAQGDDGKLSSDEYGRYPYSFGYKTTSANGNFYTIMAYGDSGQTSYRIFSNPLKTFCGGLACGVDNQSDNARSLRQTIPLVAQFRATVVADTPPVERTPPVLNDVDGDGRSDLIWRSPATSYFETWIMNGSMFSRASGYSMMTDQRILTSGDFNGDGKVDLVATNSANALQMWIGSGSWFTPVSMGRTFGAGWKPIGNVDVDADGKSDLIWVNEGTSYFETWLMDGAVLASARGLNLANDSRIMTAGDFNADGRADLLISDSTRQLSVGIGSATGFAYQPMGRTFAPGWTAIAAGDLNKDGKIDLLWRSAATSYFEAWAMDGASLMQATGFTPPAGQRIIGTGDFNNDKALDLLIIDSSNYLYGWMGTGSSFAVEPLNRTVGPGWTPLIAGQ
jgi:hypothetical protein